MVDDGVYVKGVTEGRINVARDGAISSLLKRGISVVCDDTNLPRRSVRDLARVAAKLCTPGNQIEWFVNDDFVAVPLETCIERDKKRGEMGGRYVGATVIKDMYNRYIHGETMLEIPEQSELWGGNNPDVMPYQALPGTPLAVIIDIDGTIALRGTRSPFDESRVAEDAPNWPILNLATSFMAQGFRGIVVSGRTDGCKDATIMWLDKYLPAWSDLHMRPAGDTRKDSIVKSEIFDDYIREYYNVQYVLDDRNQVVEMWRSLGLTVLQVAEGNF
jgi:hypothetical protein